MKTRFIAVTIYAVAMFCCYGVRAQYTGAHGERYTDYEQYRFFSEQDAILKNVNSTTGIIGVQMYNYSGSSSARINSQYKSKLTPEEMDEVLAKMKMEDDAYDQQSHKRYMLALQTNCYLHLYRGNNGLAELRNAAGKTIIHGNFEDVQEVKYANGAPSSWIIGISGQYSLIGRKPADTIMVLKASGFDRISKAGPDDEDWFVMTGANGKAGAFNGYSGDFMTPVAFDSIDLGEGVYDQDAKIPVKNDGRWGMWSCRDRTLAVPYDYDSVSFALSLNRDYMDDGARPIFVNRAGKWGVYDVAKGKEIVPAIYDKLASCEYDKLLLERSLNTYTPVFIGITSGQKFYYTRKFVLHRPEEAPLFGYGFEYFITPDMRQIEVPEEVKPHNKKEARSSTVIDSFFSFDRMQ